MLDNLVTAVLYIAVGLMYGIVCHFVARSQRLRSSALGSFIWPFTEYIERIYGNNDFVGKNSGKDFIKLMALFGGVKLFRDVVILIASAVLCLSMGLFVVFLIFWSWIEKGLKTREERRIDGII
ncbi:MAG: hypothetical protein AAB890_03030 [Patescibacteria group bacterium]